MIMILDTQPGVHTAIALTTSQRAVRCEHPPRAGTKAVAVLMSTRQFFAAWVFRNAISLAASR